MEYWKSKMFQIDMYIAINGLKWNPSSVIKFYNSGQFEREFHEPRECHKYIQDSRQLLDKIAAIQEMLVLNMLKTQSQPMPVKQPEFPSKDEKIKEGYAQSVSNQTTTIQSSAHTGSVNQSDSQILRPHSNLEASGASVTQPIKEYKPDDFTSIDAYYDYIEYGDLDGLIKKEDEKMVEIQHELVKEENIQKQSEAHINKLMAQNREQWAQIDANKGISQLKKDLKRVLLKPEPQVDFKFKLLNDLGVPASDVLRYEAEAEFPLTSFIGQYDNYSPEEIDALEDKDRFEAYWEQSPLGFATQVYQRSNDMISRLNNPHDPMYIP
jgi:hypothetical protein